MTQRGLSVLFALLVTFVVAGCGGGVRFRSKTGRKHDPVAAVAVRCEEPEAQLVAQAGGEVIGTITSKGELATREDLAERAQRIAAKSGGTHVVLTEKGADAFTVTQPQTSTPTTNGEVAKASFVVLRLSPLKWGALPPALRPVPRD